MTMPVDDIEEWRPVVGADGYYSVSNLGRVRRELGDGQRTYAGRILKPGLAGAGYPFVHLRVPGVLRGQRYVHRLVAEAFLGSPPTRRHEVDHLDGVRTNNHVSNLEWVTPSNNQLRAWAAGLIPINHRPSIRKVGEQHPRSKLTDADVRFIRSAEGRAMDADVVAARFDTSRMYVLRLRRGLGWTHIS